MSGIQWFLFWFVGAVGSIWVTDWQTFPRITTAVLEYIVRLADGGLVRVRLQSTCHTTV